MTLLRHSMLVLVLIAGPIRADSWDTTAKEAAKDSEVRAYRMVKLSHACGTGFARVVRVPARVLFGTRLRAAISVGSLLAAGWYLRPAYVAAAWEEEVEELLTTTMDELDTDEEKKEFAEKLATAEIKASYHSLTWERHPLHRAFHIPLIAITGMHNRQGDAWSKNDKSTSRLLMTLLQDEPSYKDWDSGDAHFLRDYDPDSGYFDGSFLPPSKHHLLIPFRAEQIFTKLKGPADVSWDPGLVTAAQMGKLGESILAKDSLIDSEGKVRRMGNQLRRLLSKKISDFKGTHDAQVAGALAGLEKDMVVQAGSYKLENHLKATTEALEKEFGKDQYDFPMADKLYMLRHKQISAALIKLRERDPDAKLDELELSIPLFLAEELLRVAKEKQ